MNPHLTLSFLPGQRCQACKEIYAQCNRRSSSLYPDHFMGKPTITFVLVTMVVGKHLMERRTVH